MEIERKYLIQKLPEDLAQYPHMEMEQAYLCTEPVVRVRKEGEDYVLTYKSKGLMVREEYNLPLTKESYEHLLEKADGTVITKTRYRIPEKNGLTIELFFTEDMEDCFLQKWSLQPRRRQTATVHRSGSERTLRCPVRIITAR